MSQCLLVQCGQWIWSTEKCVNCEGKSHFRACLWENLFPPLLNHPALFLSHSLLLLALALHFTLLSSRAWLNDWCRRRCMFFHLSFEAECIIAFVCNVPDKSALNEASRYGYPRERRLCNVQRNTNMHETFHVFMSVNNVLIRCRPATKELR